jgi:hypothetical protein
MLVLLAVLTMTDRGGERMVGGGGGPSAGAIGREAGARENRGEFINLLTWPLAFHARFRQSRF